MTRAVLFLPLLCSACWHFQLGSSVTAPIGTTADRQKLDIIECKQQAAKEWQKSVLIGFASEPDRQRADFAACMTARGYTVVPVP